MTVLKPVYSLSSSPVATSQIRIARSSPLVTSHSLSGLNARTSIAFVCPSSSVGEPFEVFHKMTEPSISPDAMMAPSLLIATAVTAASCPCREVMRLPVAGSWTLICSSLQLISNFPSPLYAIRFGETNSIGVAEPGSRLCSSPVLASHRITVPSFPMLASCLPSGL